MTTRIPWCIAHRGAREEAPENTASAFRRALAYPVDGIEFDVQMSRDGILVLFHDPTVYKLGGGRRRIGDMTIDELRQIDWGKWFHPDFAGEPLMTFEMALHFLDRFAHMFIEIKSAADERPGGHPYRLTEQLVDTLQRPGLSAFHDRIAILSFDPKVLTTAYKRAPHLRYVLNMSDQTAFPRGDAGSCLWAVDIDIGKLTHQAVLAARKRRWRLFTYTCNSPEQVAKAQQMGVDGIISDRPGWLLDQIR